MKEQRRRGKETTARKTTSRTRKRTMTWTMNMKREKERWKQVVAMSLSSTLSYVSNEREAQASRPKGIQRPLGEGN